DATLHILATAPHPAALRLVTPVVAIGLLRLRLATQRSIAVDGRSDVHVDPVALVSLRRRQFAHAPPIEHRLALFDRVRREALPPNRLRLQRVGRVGVDPLPQARECRKKLPGKLSKLTIGHSRPSSNVGTLRRDGELDGPALPRSCALPSHDPKNAAIPLGVLRRLGLSRSHWAALRNSPSRSNSGKLWLYSACFEEGKIH